MNTKNKSPIKSSIELCLSILLFSGLLGGGCSSNPKRVALWNAGLQDGNFEFSFCQTKLDENDEVIPQGLRRARFRTGLFFGSTDSYNFVDILKELDRNEGSEISTFDSNGIENESNVRIDDFLQLENGRISSDALALFAVLGVVTTASIWSFTDATGTYHNENCLNAESNNSSENGRTLMNDVISQASKDCSTSALLICIAK